jgi:putative ABC transport system permease protein
MRWPSAVPLGFRLIARDRLRFAITVAGVGFAGVLMLFLAAIYDGVRIESNGYVEDRPVDVWVMQNNARNLIRSSSFLRTATGPTIAGVAGVAEASSVLRFITTTTVRGREATLFLMGVEPRSRLSRPTLVGGAGLAGRGQIVLDRGFARRYAVRVGDSLAVQGRPFRVVGLSSGTNAVIAQFGFVALPDAQELIGLRNITSYYLVAAEPGTSPDTLAGRLRATLPRLIVLTAPVFARNNLEELENTLLPVLGIIAVFGAVVGASVLTLLLYGAVLERREDYALLKAIGSGRGVLQRLLLRQAAIAVLVGFASALVAYVVCARVVLYVVPQLALVLTWRTVAAPLVGSLVMGALGVLLPARSLDRVYPAEVFRA